VEKVLLKFLFVKRIKREITVAMGRCRQLTHCYILSLPSGLITIAMGEDDFNAPVATIYSATMAWF
jgi:hypothetical protein